MKRTYEFFHNFTINTFLLVAILLPQISHAITIAAIVIIVTHVIIVGIFIIIVTVYRLTIFPIRYFTFLHLVSYLTVNQQFGHEATENHSGQRQVMSVNGEAF
jgi:hypothetical protein